jgi:hypothetical protein
LEIFAICILAFLKGGRWPLTIGTKLATPVERQGRKASDLIEKR